ncbi:MAG TPA: alternative oxidase [Hyphomonadaceae bacterium]|nr:alternative oxidase [Hyphomonadaceae bacterium]
MTDLVRHHEAQGTSDRIALGITKFLRWFADAFFAKRYGHRAIVLETVAAVPGMVGGMMNHLKSLRRMRDDDGWIKELLDEAENERMHLMAFVALYKPTWFERLLVLVAQGAFWNAYFLLYLFAPRTAHRTIGYFEEEAIISYTEFLKQIDAGAMENIAAPKLAVDYWKLAPNAKLRDLVIAVREDEARHRDVNHGFAEKLDHNKALGQPIGEGDPTLPEHPQEHAERPA